MTEQQRAAFKKLIERHARVNSVTRAAARASLEREDDGEPTKRRTPRSGKARTRKVAAHA